MRVKVVIPALDEEDAIGLVLEALPRGRLEVGGRSVEIAEVIVVDNGSRDATAAVARRHGARVVAEPRRGYGSACLAGIEAAGDCDVIAFLDADFSDHPEEIVRLLEPLVRGEADLVIGSRMLDAASRRALFPQARFGNWLASRLLRLVYGVEVSDLGPFRAVRVEALRRIGMRDRDYGWTVEMQARAFALGLRVVEVKVSYRNRIGASKIAGTVKGTLRAGTKILYTIAREWLTFARSRRRRPPSTPA